MSKMLISLAALAALTIAAQAQSPSLPADAKPASGGEAKPADGGDTANQDTYKMKDGGMYQPPAQRPASPAQDLSVYGRT